MKSLLVLCLFAVAVYGLPAKNAEVFGDSSEESFFILPMNKHHKKEVPSVVEVEVGDSEDGSSFFPSYFRPMFFNPFSFMNFGFSDFFSTPSWLESMVPKNIPDSSVKNTTSTTKIVGGHKITVNDTVYENEKNGAVYRFQVVEILPADSQEKEGSDEKTTDKSSSSSSSSSSSGEKEIKAGSNPTGEESEKRIETTEDGIVKPDQNSHDNEIHKEEVLENNQLRVDDDLSIMDNEIEMIDFHDGSHLKKREIVDLSGDIKINRLLSENIRRGALFEIPPDVEVFDTFDYDQFPRNYPQMLDPYQFQAIQIQPPFYRR